MNLAYTASISIEEYKTRRQKVLSQMKDNSVALIFANKLARRNNDCFYPFRQDSYFWYLTGFNEPNALLVLLKQGHTQKSIVFVPPKNKLRETWDGIRLGVEKAKDVLDVDMSLSIENLEEELPKILTQATTVYHAKDLYDWADQLVNQHVTSSNLLCWRPILDEMRLIKSKTEQALMLRAAEISSLAHIRAMKATRENRYEYELEGEMLHEFYKFGARFAAYNSIIGAGSNGCILHYVDNEKALKDNELVLIDAACEVDNYAADVTRTFPVNGKYSKEQREIYSIVLEAQKKGIEIAVAGSSFKAANDQVLQIMVSGLVKLGLLKGNVDELIEQGAYKRFYMHNLGHWLGLDVHDTGDYGDQKNRRFERGMAFTIEPGLYIPDEEDIPAKYRGIGVRIEDDILITEDGNNKVLSSGVPKEIEEIELLLSEK